MVVTDPLRGVDCSWKMGHEQRYAEVTDPLRGVDCSMMVQISLLPCLLPTPCGEWIAASNDDEILSFKVTDPLRGVDCSDYNRLIYRQRRKVTDPLRGVDCSHAMERTGWLFRLPTPCGE